MNNIEGPYYTLAEAKDILGIRESELLYKIEQGEIRVVVMTPEISMLVVSYEVGGETIGHATCRYRGPLLFSDKIIRYLVDHGSLNTGQSSSLLLDPGAIRSWSTAYPFNRSVPHAPLSDWISKEVGELSPLITALPLPKEVQPPAALWGEFAHALSSTPLFKESVANALAANPHVGEFRKTGIDTLKLDFQGGLAISLSQIRAPKSELRTGIKGNATPVEVQSPSSRENQLHQVILRVLMANPGIGAKAAWAAIEKDFNEDSPIYDTDMVIKAVDPSCIAWESRRGSVNYMKYNSFESTLPRLRKELRKRQ